jgi:hypothetical protein
MGTGSFPGVRRPERGADHPPPTSAEVKERVVLYLYSLSGPSWPVLGKTLLYFTYDTILNVFSLDVAVDAFSLYPKLKQLFAL